MTARTILYARKMCFQASALALWVTLGALLTPPAAHAAPTFTVNSAADVIAGGDLTNGVCETAPGNGVCTLRAAIEKANNYPGGNVGINLTALPGGIATLTIPNSLGISANMSIVGGGATSTIIDGNQLDHPLEIFYPAVVTISGVTIRNGHSVRSEFGGGIFNTGTLTLTNSIVSGNWAYVGGGIFNGGTLTLMNSTVSGNMQAAGGTLGNSGGGIYNSGHLTLINSTVSGNTSSGSGGGITNGSAALTLINSTVSGNVAKRDGGGIVNADSSTLSLFNSTITNNQADSDFNGSGSGGGVVNGPDSGFGSLSQVTLKNSIIALNFESQKVFNSWIPAYGDCVGTLTSQGNNILYNYNTSTCTVNGQVTLADPGIGPLQKNSGWTQTHALLSGSPAIDAGNVGGCTDPLGATLTTDQRGAPRPFGPRCDIGAYEYGATLSQSLVAAILPISRSVQTGGTATVFATIINTGADAAMSCSISPLGSLPIAPLYQTTNRVTNLLTGAPNTPVDIAPGDFQTFLVALTAQAAFAPADITLSFECANRAPAVVVPGVNTLLLSASDAPVPDIVAMGVTPSGDGIVNIPSATGTGLFGVATSNVGGAGGPITVSADTSGASLPVNLFVCQTNPATGACLPPGMQASVTVTINPGQTPTFAVFAQGTGIIPFNPGVNRLFLRFRDGGNAVRGATSAALRTQ